MRRWIGLGAAALGVAVSGLTCPLLDNTTNKPRVAALRGFASEQELRDYLVDQAKAGLNRSSGGGSTPFFPFFGGMGLPSAPVAEDAADGDAATGADDGSLDYSTTNLQEAGVDESDIVKNDGQTIFVLDGRTIHVVNADPPADMVEIAAIDLDFHGDSLYLNGSTLIALSQSYGYSYYYDDGPVAFEGGRAPAQSADAGNADSSADVIGGPYFDGAQTNIDFFDVSDPAQPASVAGVKLEGRLVSSRLIGTRLHVVTSTVPRFPFEATPTALEATTIDEWIPDYEVQRADGSRRRGKIVGWPDVFRPEDPNGYGITTVVTIDVADPSGEFASTAITANAGIIYASTHSLYITDTERSFIDFTTHTDTIVHKLAFTDSGTDYIASGIVPGRPLNQYSLGEYDDHLRIATTVAEFSATPSNNVYVLGENGISLDVVGRIENIAPGEIIYAVRFLGTRGFVVTFQRIDPLFTLDLSDHANPRIIGELKVPGYSDYIHLLDENHLLTIGKDAEDAGSFAWVQGVQLSIFDVTDMANPTLLHKEIIGGRGSHSEANTNPKAFNYFAPLNALAIPMDEYGGGTTGPEFAGHVFTGLYVYRVTVEDGFERLGRIASSDGMQQDGCFRFYGGFTRGVFIGDTVYAVRRDGVKAAAIDDLDTLIGEVTFEGAPPHHLECWFIEPDDFLPVGNDVR